MILENHQIPEEIRAWTRRHGKRIHKAVKKGHSTIVLYTKDLMKTLWRKTGDKWIFHTTLRGIQS